MSEPVHRKLAEGRWFTFSIAEQLANVGSEVERATRWHQRGDREHFEKAFDRMLDLLDLTIADPRWRGKRRLRELVRLREVLCDLFYNDDSYNTTFEYIGKYFLYFGIAARANR